MQSITQGQSSLLQHPLSDVARQRGGGFTLVELLVVISIISLITAMLLPAVNKVHLQALRLRNMNNQRQVIHAVNEFAVDSDNKYPESVATLGFGENWGWSEPTMITAYRQRNASTYRSMSAYLYSYIDDSDLFYCPCAPEELDKLQDAWVAGEQWDDPDTGPVPDPVIGTYCFYWNYIGYLPDRDRTFKGPKVLMGGGGQSDLIVSDYFGRGHWRSPLSYGACEPFPHAGVVAAGDVSSAYWSIPQEQVNLESLEIRLHAGYADGHVERYKASETVPMQVSLTGDGLSPYPAGVGPGEFFLPRAALR